MILDAYRWADEALLDTANYAVRFWNWSTGRPKSDLANGLITASVSFVIAGHL